MGEVMTEMEKAIEAMERGDYATAFKISLPLAEQGDAEAQYNLGFMYDDGLGVPQDYAEAMKWYRKSAEQGDADAQNNLGSMYKEGQGVSQDYVQAYMWLDLAAKKGDVHFKKADSYICPDRPARPQHSKCKRRRKFIAASRPTTVLMNSAGHQIIRCAN